MFFTQLGCPSSAAWQWSKAASLAPLAEQLINVAFGDAEHFCNLFVGAKLLINGIDNLLTQFYGICFHIPYINNLYTHVKTAVELQLPEQVAARLMEAAKRLGVSREALLQASVEEKLARLDEDFLSAANYVLEKSTELYRRLA
jgi:antitoxin FitA